MTHKDSGLFDAMPTRHRGSKPRNVPRGRALKMVSEIPSRHAKIFRRGNSGGGPPDPVSRDKGRFT